MIQIEGSFYNIDDYQPTSTLIGEGSFGKVFICKKNSDGKEYAIKYINFDGFKGLEQMYFIRESIILNSLHHPCIIKFYGINLQSFRDETKLEPSIITEYLRRGSLESILRAERSNKVVRGWTPTKKYIVLIGISHAMRYIHRQKILHRDLKPDNILVDDNFYPKICDFGFARCFTKLLEQSVQNATTGIGSPLCMAPEMFSADCIYDKSIDVYAFAITAFEIIAGKVPYHELGKIMPIPFIQKVISGYRPQFTDKVTKKMRNLLKRCWSEDSKKRPSFDDIFNELSNDTSYIGEKVDESEIRKFVEMLHREDATSTHETKEAVEIEEKDHFYEKQKEKEKLSEERDAYLTIIKAFANKTKNIDEIEYNNCNIIHAACRSGNLELVKYLISLHEIDIKSKNIFIYFS